MKRALMSGDLLNAAGAGGGLSAEEAARRLSTDGPNEIARGEGRSLLTIARDILFEPMFALLLMAGIIYFLLGDFGEAAILMVFATLSIAIAILQENRSERMLDALRDLSAPEAHVVRGGAHLRIPAREVVRGDLLMVGEGERVPADARLLRAQDLMADESLLTGESVPVRKAVGDPNAPVGEVRPGGDDLPLVFSGTMIVRGQGTARVIATGGASEIGKIGVALRDIESVPPRLTIQTRKLVVMVAIAGFSVTLAMVILFGFLRGDWLHAILGGIALGMSMLPEEFPLVLTVFMVMGAWRISRARVLTRKAAAIETLGAATILCTDKTGTLTENRMRIVELRAGGEVFRASAKGETLVPEPVAALVECGILASAAEPFDPMEQAFYAFHETHLPHRRHPHADRAEAREWGLTPELLAVTKAWTATDGGADIVAAKGAPEAIFHLCRLSEIDAARLHRDVDEMARRGLRVLGVACARPGAPCNGGDWPDNACDLATSFKFVGFVGLADPLRAHVREAVEECRSAGIKVVMITGDHPATAHAIALEAGITDGKVLTGADLEAMSDEALAAAVGQAGVFARIAPIQKLRIVQAFKARGEVVAMTGDGVNDAPSLKAADIAIAMGKRGTDVAREAASIVLLDDDFLSIVRTIRLGRRIYDNLRKAMGYIVALHVPIGGMALMPLLTGMPIMFAPVHIAFMEMVIDPVCSVVFEAEAEERRIMRRPPRAPGAPLFSRALILWALIQGVLAFAAAAGMYLYGLSEGLNEADVRALAFVTLVLANLALVAVNRSFASSPLDLVRRPNPFFWGIVALVVPLLMITVSWGPAERLFDFGDMSLMQVGLCVGAAFSVLVILELLKVLWRARLTE